MFRVLLIDGNSRAKTLHYAAPDDVPGRMHSDIKRIVRAASGAQPILLWDHPDSKMTRRQEYAGYKAERDDKPAAEAAVRNCVQYFKDKYPYWFHPQYEADDLLATLSLRFPDIPMLIFSNDKDMFALLGGPAIRQQLRSLQGPDSEWEFYTAEMVEQRFGIKFHQYVEYRALVGDSVDGVPGIKGIGDTTAVKIFQRYDTIAEAVRNIDEVPILPRFRKLLLAGWSDGTFAKMLSLVTFRTFKDELPPGIVSAIQATRRIGYPTRHNNTLDSLLQVGLVKPVSASLPPF